jgi:hypothetical protein
MDCVWTLRKFALEKKSLGLKQEIERLEKANELKKVLIVMKKYQDVKMELSRMPNQEL